MNALHCSGGDTPKLTCAYAEKTVGCVENWLSVKLVQELLNSITISVESTTTGQPMCYAARTTHVDNVVRRRAVKKQMKSI